MEGNGILSFSSYLTNQRPPILSMFLKKAGSRKIIKLDIYRKPVSGMAQKVLNLMSSGQWNREKQKIPYDDVYHLMAVITLDDKTKIFTDKAQTTNFKIASGKYDGDHIEITGDSLNNRTFLQLIEGMENMFKATNMPAYKYSTVNNCQMYIYNLVNGGLGLVDNEINKFIKQNTEELLGPKVRSVAKATTDLAGAFGSLLGSGDDITNYSNPTAVFKKAKSIYGKDVQIKLSTRKGKKYMLYDPNTSKWIHFGASNMEDFTKHKNKARRDNFKSRFQKYADAPPYTPGFASYYLLW